MDILPERAAAAFQETPRQLPNGNTAQLGQLGQGGRHGLVLKALVDQSQAPGRKTAMRHVVRHAFEIATEFDSQLCRDGADEQPGVATRTARFLSQASKQQSDWMTGYVERSQQARLGPVHLIAEPVAGQFAAQFTSDGIVLAIAIPSQVKRMAWRDQYNVAQRFETMAAPGVDESTAHVCRARRDTQVKQGVIAADDGLSICRHIGVQQTDIGGRETEIGAVASMDRPSWLLQFPVLPADDPQCVGSSATIWPICRLLSRMERL